MPFLSRSVSEAQLRRACLQQGCCHDLLCRLSAAVARGPSNQHEGNAIWAMKECLASTNTASALLSWTRVPIPRAHKLLWLHPCPLSPPAAAYPAAYPENAFDHMDFSLSFCFLMAALVLVSRLVTSLSAGASSVALTRSASASSCMRLASYAATHREMAHGRFSQRVVGTSGLVVAADGPTARRYRALTKSALILSASSQFCTAPQGHDAISVDHCPPPLLL